METKPILLAEDSPNDVELILTGLAEHHLANQVVVARDGAEALDYLFRRGPYAGRTGAEPMLILLDVNMPRVGGLEVLKQIKEDERLRPIPVVMLTSSREERDVMAGYQNGANAYVVKPVAFDEFVSAVKQIGLFWLLINEPRPGVAAVKRPALAAAR